MDEDVEKRTLIALGGRRPFVQHINTIVDYTFFWIMGIWEYYRTYGDRTFVEQMGGSIDASLADGRLTIRMSFPC